MEGVLQKLNRPKALVVVVVVAFVVNGLLFYRYQHSITEALTSGSSLAAEPGAVATAAPASFSVPAEQQKSSSPKKKTDDAKKGILATALDKLGLDVDGSSETSQTPYVPLSRLSASPAPETGDAPAGANATEAPSTKEETPATEWEADEQAADEPTPAKPEPASAPDRREPDEPPRRPRSAPTTAPPIPQDPPESADAAPNGTLEEPAPEEESTERGEEPPIPPPFLNEEEDRPSAPAEQPGPLVPPTSPAQCEGGGLEDEDECLDFDAPEGKKEPRKDHKE